MSTSRNDNAKILGSGGGGIDVLTTFVADYDCTANDPAGENRPARSIVADAAVAIIDAAGETHVLPASLSPRQWVGFEIHQILGSSSGTTSTAVVVIW